MKTFIAFVAGVIAGSACLTGCASAREHTQEAAMLAEAAAHQVELSECVAKGKRAKSYAAYAICADAVDQRYGIAITDGGGR